MAGDEGGYDADSGGKRWWYSALAVPAGLHAPVRLHGSQSVLHGDVNQRRSEPEHDAHEHHLDPRRAAPQRLALALAFPVKQQAIEHLMHRPIPPEHNKHLPPLVPFPLPGVPPPPQPPPQPRPVPPAPSAQHPLLLLLLPRRRRAQDPPRAQQRRRDAPVRLGGVGAGAGVEDHGQGGAGARAGGGGGREEGEEEGEGGLCERETESECAGGGGGGEEGEGGRTSSAELGGGCMLRV